MSEVSNSVESMINNIVTIVFRKHFYYITDPDLEMDLRQEGFLKAYSLLAEGNYDPSKNLRTFIYTGVRNAMTNYMYHVNKESHTDLDLVVSQSWQRYEGITQDGYWEGKLFYLDKESLNEESLNLELVNQICKKYIMFGDYTQIVLNEFKNLGLYPRRVKLTNDITIIPFVKDAIIGEIIYNMINRM